MPILKNQGGSALITVLIGFGVVALTSSVVVSLLTMAKRDAVLASADTDFDALISELHSILENEKSCRTAFGGDEGYAPPPAGPVVNAAHRQKFRPNGPLVDGHRVNNANITLYADFLGTVFLNAGSTYGRLKNISLQLISADPAEALTSDLLTFKGYLLVTATKNVGGNLSGGVTNISNAKGSLATLPLNIRINADVAGQRWIISCSGVSYADSLKGLPACKSDEMLTRDADGSFRCLQTICPAWLEQSFSSPYRAVPASVAGNVYCVYAGDPVPAPASPKGACNPARENPVPGCPAP